REATRAARHAVARRSDGRPRRLPRGRSPRPRWRSARRLRRPESRAREVEGLDTPLCDGGVRGVLVLLPPLDPVAAAEAVPEPDPVGDRLDVARDDVERLERLQPTAVPIG